MRTGIVIGAGDFGAEVAEWYAATGVEVLGLLDDDPDRAGVTHGQYEVLGTTGWLASTTETEVVVGVGSSVARKQILQRLLELGIRPTTVVHPTAFVGPQVTLGPGAVICPNVSISRNVEVGQLAVVNIACTVGHDVIIGECATLAPGVDLGGRVTVSPGANVGIGASVIQGVVIGTDAVVGAGAVVISDVADHTTVVGAPARPTRR